MVVKERVVKIAIIDLYNNEPNQGLRCIQDIVENCDRKFSSCRVDYNVFETRYQGEIPGLAYDVYISSGGPGSPFAGEGKEWERKYFNLLDKVWDYNRRDTHPKKHIFFICHSFQMMCRFFKLGTVQKRCRRSFGIYPVFKTNAGRNDWLLTGLPESYYTADFREYEVIEPNCAAFNGLGAKIISREQERLDPSLERAVMAIRISDEIVGTQYHPEANPVSMLYHFRQPKRKQQVIEELGEKRYLDMITHLEDATNIMLTRETVLPNFLANAIRQLCSGAPTLRDVRR